MSGSVWEWTSTRYDALAYRSPNTPLEPETQPGMENRVVRGGSWADCPQAATVSFRMSLPRAHQVRDRFLNPNIGFRICRAIA